MKYSIHKDDLTKINYDLYKTLLGHHNEFYSSPGKEHYKLLSYFSTLFNNSNIINIGTHEGHSALALSYNNSNKIHTFDIVDKVALAVKNVANIHFNTDNLFDKEIFNKWREVIVSSPFIFLDVDPHNGVMELEFITWLKEIDYKGFVICDDIWYFKEMRDNFWYKIEDKYKYDLTDIGHWSGTGIITFNPDVQFDKFVVSNWTLVTAYFNLTKCYDASPEINAKGVDYYLSHSLSTLNLPHNLVIFCDEDSIGYMIDGGKLHKHTDPNVNNLVHTRFNVYVQLPNEGGYPIYSNNLYKLKERRYICCRAGIDYHECQLVKGDRARIVLSFGFLLPVDRVIKIIYDY